MLGLIARKLGMSQVFEGDRAVAITLLEAERGVITQIKTKERDGYDAVQVGFIETKESRLRKSEVGKFKKLGIPPRKVLKEFKPSDVSNFEPKSQITLDMFDVGDSVDVIGKSKGRGFSGVMKRHGFHGGPDSHGSMFNRRPGSIGNCEFPGRVVKGRKMPGHYGNKRVTVKNLRVVYINKELNLIGVKGAVPGSKGEYVTIVKRGS